MYIERLKCNFCSGSVHIIPTCSLQRGNRRFTDSTSYSQYFDQILRSSELSLRNGIDFGNAKENYPDNGEIHKSKHSSVFSAQNGQRIRYCVLLLVNYRNSSIRM